MVFCSNCGHELDNDGKFCPNCGASCDDSIDKVKDKLNYNKSTTINSTNNDKNSKYQKFNSNSNSNSKYPQFDSKSENHHTQSNKNSNGGLNTLLCIVGIVVVIIIVFGVISIFSNSGGIADIQQVSMKKPVSGHGMYNTQNGWKAIPGGTTFSIRFVPHKDILHYQNVKLVNGAIRYNNGTEVVFNNQNMNLGLDYENTEFPTQSFLYKDSWYTFTFKHADSARNIEQISHLKGDLVVDTTTEQNILLAHIDNDVIMK